MSNKKRVKLVISISKVTKKQGHIRFKFFNKYKEDHSSYILQKGALAITSSVYRKYLSSVETVQVNYACDKSSYDQRYLFNES